MDIFLVIYNYANDGGRDKRSFLVCVVSIIKNYFVSSQDSMGMEQVHIIELTTKHDRRGNLSIIESGTTLPFEIARTYWIYDVPGGAHRTGHAFRTQHEFIVALSGSFDVILDDGNERRRFHLCRSHHGLYIPNMMWRELDNFSTGSVAMVLSSTLYDAIDYIEDYALYKKELNRDE